MANGIGMTLGPVISSFVFKSIGYSGTFYFFGALISLIGIITVYSMIPKYLDGKQEEDADNKDEGNVSKSTNKPVTWCVFFTNKRSFLAIFICFMSCLSMQFYDAILSVHLVEMGMLDTQSGYGFTINCFTYSFGSLGMGYLCTKWERRYVLLMSCAICASALFVMAPASILGLPNKVWLILTGLAILGIGVAGLTVPIMPEEVEPVLE
jgi:MFS family permease